MADIDATNWTEDDNSNTTAAPDGAPEGMAPSGVNNVLRAIMGAVKRWRNRLSTKTTAGTSTAYTLSYTVAPGALVDGMTHLVKFHATNGAAATLNVNGLGALPIHTFQGVNGTGIDWAVAPAGTINANQILPVAYDLASGTYRVIQPSGPIVWVGSPAAVSSFDIATSIPSNINHLVCHFELQPGTTGATFGVRTRNAAGTVDSGGTDYANANSTAQGSAVAGSSATGSSMSLTTNAVDSGNTSFSGDFSIANIQALTFTKFQSRCCYLSGGALQCVSGGGERLDANRITGLQFVSNTTFTGKITLIGYV